MSALGQKQTCATHKAMSALPPKADIAQAEPTDRTAPAAIRPSTRDYSPLRLENLFCSCTPSATFPSEPRSVGILPREKRERLHHSAIELCTLESG